ncbi:MAG: M1 family metallopeptidase [Bacteroidota bacterium]
MRLLAFVLLAAAASAQPSRNDSGRPLLPEQAAIDVTYADIDLSLDIENRSIQGSVVTEARVVQPTATLVFDLDAPLAVTAAEEVGYVVGTGEEIALPRRFARDEHRVRIHLGRTVQPGQGVRVRIAYRGQPRVAPNPPWEGGVTWAETVSGDPWVAVSCQMNGADLWWPVKDHPSDEVDSLRISLRVPEALRAIANGVSEGRETHGDGTATEHWFVSQPINNYGVSFGVGPFETVTADYESPAGWRQPVPFFVLPENADDARRQLPGFLDAMAFLERTFGPYPWRADGYKLLHTPYLGMEHQTLVAYGSDFQDNEYGFDWLHYHELAHEWWANLATAPDWRDFWVHESFANYAEALYAEDIARRRDGDDAAAAAYLRYMQRSRDRMRNEIPLAPRETRTAQQMYGVERGGNPDIYTKGGWVLHTLRWHLNDDVRFFAALRSLLYPTELDEATTDGRQARFVSTADVLAAFSRVAGRDLSDVFEVYVRQPELPLLSVEGSPTEVRLRWVLPESVADRTFDVPVEVAIDGQRQRIAMTGGSGAFAVSANSDVEIDPDGRVLFELLD